MNKKQNVLIIAALTFGTTLIAQGQTSEKELILPNEGRGNSRVEHLGKSIDQMIYEFMEKEKIPGMTLAIVQAPYIPRVVGYGVANAETKQLASSKTIWAAGPISQAYVAVAIMQLVEKNLLQLNAPISKYLSNLPTPWKEITVFQLLQHASGIADYQKNVNFNAFKNFSSKELLSMSAEVPLQFQPGTDVDQSATNFLLLTEIIEKISQQSYHDFVTENQIKFLGLKRTKFQEDFSFLDNEEINQQKLKHALFTKESRFIDPAEPAFGTIEKNNKLFAVQRFNSSVQKGFSDIWASAEDISTWDIALAGGILIKNPQNRDLIYKPTTLSNGKIVPAMSGWQFQRHPGLMDIKGTVPGFSSFLSRFTDPNELVCVTLMCNKENVDLSNLGRRIASAFGKKLSSGLNDNLYYTQESIFDVPQTVERLEKNLKKLNIPIFAKINHQQNAENVKMQLKPSMVVVFGNPLVGTKLMQSNPAISLDLPLRIAVWEDKNGSVWIATPQIESIAKAHQMEQDETIQIIQKLLEKLIKEAANLY